MEELRALVLRTRGGDLGAFEQIVRRFQDMAYGCAYSLLGDFHLAEDASQEAFIEAYRQLRQLRDPDAFPGWFRRIVFKHCHRITRRKRVESVSLDAAPAPASADVGPAQAAERREIREKVLDAVRALPEHERMATTLFYINGYSQKEVAEFLEVPVTTVKNRLYTSRKQLKERMFAMVSDELRSHPLPPEFPERIRLLLGLPRPLDIEGHPVRRMWDLFRTCVPDLAFVEFDEICSQSICMDRPEEMLSKAHRLDDERILRPELTSQLIDHWLGGGGGPISCVTAGRVFRRVQDAGPTSLEVHHQAEVLWSGAGFTEEQCEAAIKNTTATLLPGVEYSTTRFSYGGVPEAKVYDASWRGQSVSIAVGGMISDDLLAKAGLDPTRDGVISFCFGLERCAQVHLDLDDIRDLWRPPHVPEE